MPTASFLTPDIGVRRRAPWWSSWLKEERLAPLRRDSVNRGVLLCLLLLAPLLALQLQRRVSDAVRDNQAQRDDTLALIEATFASVSRNTRDWGHWDETLDFVSGRHKGYRAMLSTSPVFEAGTLLVLLRPDGSTLLIHSDPRFRVNANERIANCVRGNLNHLPRVSSSVRLLCEGTNGLLYLGAATPISNDSSSAPRAGTLSFLEPLQINEYTPRIRQRLATLSGQFMFVPKASVAAARGVEMIQPPVHSSRDTLVGLRRGTNLPVVAAAFGRDLPLLLAVPLLALILRIMALLERRRQRLLQRQVERRASQRIRRTCARLDRLMEAVVPAAEGSGNASGKASEPTQILGRLSAVEAGPSTPPPTASSTDKASPAARQLEDLGRHFESFLSNASQLALLDPLTKLPNRRYFIEQLTLMAARAKDSMSLALLFIDIDRFKVINDTYGHGIGDAVLISVCERLRQTLQPQDFMGRYGGDELAVILDLSQVEGSGLEARHQEARKRAEAMIADVSAPVQVGALSIAVSLSIGIAMADPEEPRITTLIQRSDLAMYQAKRSRSSRIIGPGEVLDIPQLSSYQLYNELIEALSNRRIEVFFQPICSSEGHWLGMEALARWQHPQQGWIQPDVFIELAELHRQMKPLGEELIRQSVAGFRQLLGLDPGLKLYLNLSASQLLDPDLADFLLEAVATETLRPDQLVLELTEHSILEPNIQVERNLARLRGSGCRLALDDFGTGYSSLVRLLSLRPDLIKIDSAFIRAMESDEDAGHIVALIAGLAARLGLELVAEGIEDASALVRLEDLGIGLFQGYALGRPAAASSWLKAGPMAPDADVERRGAQETASNRSIV